MNGTWVRRLITAFFLIWISITGVAQTEDTENDNNPEKKGALWDAWNKVVTVFEDTMDKQTAENRDPWESWNRNVFAFNDVADRWVLSPVARGYQWVTPDPVQHGIGNMFSNLLDINVIINDLLQFKLVQAASDSGRFLVNTTVGVGGLFDVASSIGLEKNNEDLGQTLGKWGVGSGPYIVVPLLGSYTLRSGVGFIGDSAVDVIGLISHTPTRNQIVATRLIDGRASLFAAESLAESLITGDRYAFVRDAYLQRRDFLANDGELEDDFGDEDFDDFDDLEELEE